MACEECERQKKTISHLWSLLLPAVNYLSHDATCSFNKRKHTPCNCGLEELQVRMAHTPNPEVPDGM